MLLYIPYHTHMYKMLALALAFAGPAYAAVAAVAAAGPLPFAPAFERPQATLAFLPSTSIPPWADNASAARSASGLVVKLTNAESGHALVSTSHSFTRGGAEGEGETHDWRRGWSLSEHRSGGQRGR